MLLNRSTSTPWLIAEVATMLRTRWLIQWGVVLSRKAALCVAHDGLDILHINAAEDETTVEPLHRNSRRPMAGPNRRIEGVHDLVASLFVGDLGQGDPVKVDDS
jgi:hypothetical protein